LPEGFGHLRVFQMGDGRQDLRFLHVRSYALHQLEQDDTACPYRIFEDEGFERIAGSGSLFEKFYPDARVRQYAATFFAQGASPVHAAL